MKLCCSCDMQPQFPMKATVGCAYNRSVDEQLLAGLEKCSVLDDLLLVKLHTVAPLVFGLVHGSIGALQNLLLRAVGR